MLDDQTFTERQQVAKQPGTCLHCHASVYVPYKKAGRRRPHQGLREDEPDAVRRGAQARRRIRSPASTATTRRRCSSASRGRASSKASARCKASQGVAELRREHAWRRARRCAPSSAASATSSTTSRARRSGSSIRGRRGSRSTRSSPTTTTTGFKDWTHAETGAPVLKAQHPEFEMWNQGIHARSGVACADCHMPYKRVGALKISDHHVRSPLLNINQRLPDLPQVAGGGAARRASRRSRTARSSCANMAMDALLDLIGDIKAARGAESADAELAAGPRLPAARRSSTSTSSRPRTRWASTRRRRRRASWPSRSTSRARGRRRSQGSQWGLSGSPRPAARTARRSARPAPAAPPHGNLPLYHTHATGTVTRSRSTGRCCASAIRRALYGIEPASLLGLFRERPQRPIRR